MVWSFLYSPSMPDHPVETSPAAFYFRFPVYNGREPYPSTNDQKCPAVHYLVRSWTATLPRTKRIRLRGAVQKIIGTPIFGGRTESDDTGTAPPAVRLFIQRVGDDLTKDTYRWWSNPTKADIRLGRFDLSVPLDPRHWSSVFGHPGATLPDEFIDAITHPMRIGMTFGQGNDFGHGVYCRKGEARFVCQFFGVTAA